MTETFTLLDYVRGLNYPSTEVTIYLDTDAIYKLDRDVDDEKEYEALRKRVRDSAVTFTLQGQSPAEVQAIIDLVKEDSDKADQTIVAASIKKVTKGEAVDESAWDAEKVAELSKIMGIAQYNQLKSAVMEVNLSAKLYDDSIDAGFHSELSESSRKLRAGTSGTDGA